MSIRFRILSFLKFSILNRIIVFFNQYFRHAIFINFLGLDIYGIWIFLMTIPAYLTLSDFGISDTAENHINLNLFKTSNLEISKIFWSSVSIAIFIFCLLFLSLNLSLGNIINNYTKLYPITNGNNLYFINLIFLYSFLIIINKKFQSLIAANRHYNFLINLRSISILIELFCIFIVFFSKLNLETLIIFFIFIRFLMLLITFIKFSSYKIITFKFSDLSFFNYIGLYKKSFMFLLAPIVNLIRLQGVVFLLMNFFSSNLVSIYSVTSTLIRSTSIMVHLTSSPINIESAKLFAEKAYKRILNLLNLQISFYFWISIFLFPFFFLLSDEIFYLWLNQNDILNMEFILILFFSNIFFLISRPYHSFILSINKHNEYIFITTILSIILFVIFYLILSNNIILNPLFMILFIDFFIYIISIYSINRIIYKVDFLNSLNPFGLKKIFNMTKNHFFNEKK